jgi:hypothetical protein
MATWRAVLVQGGYIVNRGERCGTLHEGHDTDYGLLSTPSHVGSTFEIRKAERGNALGSNQLMTAV